MEKIRSDTYAPVKVVFSLYLAIDTKKNESGKENKDKCPKEFDA